MIKLYGRGHSRSFRGLWALAEAGLEYEYIHVQPGGDIPSYYRTINFQGKVPTLVDGEVVLTESAAIVNYAAMLSPAKELLPTNIAERARYDEICYFVMTDLEQPLWSIGKHRFALPEAVRQPGMQKTAQFEFEKSLRALHHHFDGSGYVAGELFTMADILLAHTINWAERFEMPIDAAFIKYRDRMYSRPACQHSLVVIEAHK